MIKNTFVGPVEGKVVHANTVQTVKSRASNENILDKQRTILFRSSTLLYYLALSTDYTDGELLVLVMTDISHYRTSMNTPFDILQNISVLFGYFRKLPAINIRFSRTKHIPRIYKLLLPF